MKAPVPSRRAIAALAWVVIIVVLLAFAWLAGENRKFAERDEQSLADRRQLAERLGRAEADLKAEEATLAALLEQIRQLGEKPVVEPSDPPESGQLISIPGPRGLSCIEEIGYPRCRGSEGPSGRPGGEGEPGAPGAQGEQGPRGEKGDTGERGAPGEQGPAGPAGRGIEDAKCGDDGRWTLWWTDGTTSDGGPCVVTPGNSGAKQ